MHNSTKIIIIPGWGGNKETWADFVHLLKEKNVDVDIIELPCFGDEPCPDTVWGIEEYGKFVAEKIKNIKNENQKTVLLAHSFGGQVGAYTVAQDNTLVDSLILTASAVFRPRKTVRKLFFQLVAKIGKFIFKLPVIEKADVWAKKVLYRAVTPASDYNKTSGIKREIFKKIIREDLTEIIPNIKIPTLVVWGTMDKYLPVRDAYRLDQLLPHSQLQIIKRGRHGLHIYNKKEFLHIIKNFVN